MKLLYKHSCLIYKLCNAIHLKCNEVVFFALEGSFETVAEGVLNTYAQLEEVGN